MRCSTMICIVSAHNFDSEFTELQFVLNIWVCVSFVCGQKLLTTHWLFFSPTKFLSLTDFSSVAVVIRSLLWIEKVFTLCFGTCTYKTHARSTTFGMSDKNEQQAQRTRCTYAQKVITRTWSCSPAYSMLWKMVHVYRLRTSIRAKYRRYQRCISMAAFIAVTNQKTQRKQSQE